MQLQHFWSADARRIMENLLKKSYRLKIKRIKQYSYLLLLMNHCLHCTPMDVVCCACSFGRCRWFLAGVKVGPSGHCQYLSRSDCILSVGVSASAIIPLVSGSGSASWVHDTGARAIEKKDNYFFNNHFREEESKTKRSAMMRKLFLLFIVRAAHLPHLLVI